MADKGLIAKVQYPPAVKQMQAKAAAASSDTRLNNLKPKTTQEINVASLTSTSGMPDITAALRNAGNAGLPASAQGEFESARIKAAIAEANRLRAAGKTEEAKKLEAQTKLALTQARMTAATSQGGLTSPTGGVALPTTTPYSNYPSTMSAAPSNPVTINVYPSEGMDEREIAAIVSREIALQLRKGALV